MMATHGRSNWRCDRADADLSSVRGWHVAKNSFRPLTRPGSFLLASAKRNGTKEKRFLDNSSPIRHSFRDFPTRHPWLGRKTPHIPVQRPPGLALSASLPHGQKPVVCGDYSKYLSSCRRPCRLRLAGLHAFAAAVEGTHASDERATS
jgi:hypothetical protein